MGTSKCTPRYPLGPTCAQCFGSEGNDLGVRGGSLVTREVVGTPKLVCRGDGDPNKYSLICITLYLCSLHWEWGDQAGKEGSGPWCKTFGLLISLQLTPACSSSLPAHSPCSSLLQLAPACPLAPCPPEVVGTPIHTKLFIGHWEQAGSELEQGANHLVKLSLPDFFFERSSHFCEQKQIVTFTFLSSISSETNTERI